VTTLLAIAAVWFALVLLWLALAAPLLRRGPRCDEGTGLVWRCVVLYCRFWHRLQLRGREHVPAGEGAHQGLIVISNHTGALDPLLLQCGCPFFIRWMMASEQMTPRLGRVWEWIRVIPVDRDGKDTGPLREAIRHVQAGGAVGIFPEGRITVPPGEIRPFLPGAGLLVTRTKAPVLVAWIRGTPDTNEAAPAFRMRSHAEVDFIGLYRFDEERDPALVTAKLREIIRKASGWPLNEEIIPPGGPRPADG